MPPPSPSATAAPDTPTGSSDGPASGAAPSATERAGGAVWGAVEEALRMGFGARAAWLPALLVPTFAVSLTVDQWPRITDQLGHLHLFDPLALQFDRGGMRLVSVWHLAWAVVWLRVQATCVGGLLVGFDRRRAGLGEASVRVRDLWRAGRAVASDCFWVLVARLSLALLACAALLGVPWFLLRPPVLVPQLMPALEAPLALAFAVLALLTFVYLAVLEVACQLALVSSVANRRGAVSALQHAWKLMQSSPGATLRAAGAHFALVIVVGFAIGATGDALGGSLRTIAALLVVAIAGTVQVCLWDRIYGLLGGWRTAPPEPLGDARASGGDAA